MGRRNEVFDKLFLILKRKNINFCDRRGVNGKLYIYANQGINETEIINVFKTYNVVFNNSTNVNYSIETSDVLYTLSNRELQKINFVKPKKENQNNFVELLKENYHYGFNINSPIELMRYKKAYLEKTGDQILITDEQLKAEILQAGFLFENKVYLIPSSVKDLLARVLKI